MARVYLETSFLSACVTERSDPKSEFRREESRRWWLDERQFHKLHVSAEVLRELSSPSFLHRDNALALAAEAEMLQITESVLGLARILVREQAMPGPESAGDAIHVAIATVHQIETILSWNVRHLANRNKVAHLREICRRVGYIPPEILTPDTYWISPE